MANDAMDLRGKRVTVMGLGLYGGGAGVVRFLAKRGAIVTATDLRDAATLKPSLDALADLNAMPGVTAPTYVLGTHRDQDFANAQMVVKNPAVPNDSPYLALARQAGADIEMEMSLFFRLCPAPIIGITGTKGKTTTSTLTAELLKAVRPDTVMAGNMRLSALDLLDNGKIGPDTPVVLELSSWQLEIFGEIPQPRSPEIATITNMSPDHMNRYATYRDYVQAKELIYRYQMPTDVFVCNREDSLADEWRNQAPGRIVWFGIEDVGGAAAFVKDGWFCWRPSADAPVEQIAPLSEWQQPGHHNRLNALCAIALTKSRLPDAPAAALRSALAGFTGVRDRLETIATINGVRFINDTTATTPAATVAALDALFPPGKTWKETGHLFLICGGADKNLDFEPMAQALQARSFNQIWSILLLEGTATPKLLATLNENILQQFIEGPFTDLPSAVKAAHAAAKAGDVVLLSPGCASFGMFKNEFDRGDQFRKIVAEIAENH